MGRSNGYIIGFAAAVCLVCSIFVSGLAVALKPQQEQNKVLDRQVKVLTVVGLLDEGSTASPAEIQKLFDENIKAKVVDLESGEYVDNIDAKTFDQKKLLSDPMMSTDITPNPAGVPRVPKQALVYHVTDAAGNLEVLVLPIEGKGLWSTLYGYLALESDLNTVRGITFYQHGETPGLGGEVDNPRWKSLWPGRKVFDADNQPVIEVVKGQAGPVAEAPHKIDGLSGATLTSRGVTHLVQLWMGDKGFGHYLDKLRAKGDRS